MFLGLSLSVFAENIHFNDLIYKLKSADNSKETVENEYYIDAENDDVWTSKVEITYYPEISNPLKYASDVDKNVSAADNQLLLKFVQNKKIDIAVLSYLENEVNDDCACFIYNVLKFEKHPDKGIMVLRFAKKYRVNSKNDIQKVANEVKAINDDYIERIIISPIPPIVKELNN
jgi:hypothetical protein